MIATYFLQKDHTGTFNIGFENKKIINIAKTITHNLNNVKFFSDKSNDKRSYRLNSEKIINIGYKQN